MSDPRASLRRIPKIDVLLERAASAEGLVALPRALLIEAVRDVVEAYRRDVAGGGGDLAAGGEYFDTDAWLGAVRDWVSRRLRRKHVRVVNATGILLHTGIGRAPLSDAAIEAAAAAARYAVVEVDPDSGERDLRESRIAELLCELTGAEAATVCNNNAAATLLALGALAAGREVIVARGELVEIGGGFRMPDVMAASGCRLREVGTTNRTYARDYEAAIGDQTGLLLKVHTSNFRIVGFTHEPAEEELADLSRQFGIPYVYDLGSGMLRPVDVVPLSGEPDVRAAVARGADVVTFSGDKLLCGPQAGLIVGRRDLVERIRTHPFYRAVRPGKLDLAALEATLLAWRESEVGIPALPLYQALARTREDLLATADALAAALVEQAGVAIEILDTDGFLGSGSAPVRRVPGVAVAVAKDGLSPDRLADRLRRGDPRVFPRIDDGRVLLETRALFESDRDLLPAAVATACAT